jgi:hypothetical protein
MGWHFCKHPCWHRALILFGTVGYFYGVGLGGLHVFRPGLHGQAALWVPVAFLVSTWFFNHLLQGRCQGPEPRPSDGRRMAGLALLLASIALISRNDHD